MHSEENAARSMVYDVRHPVDHVIAGLNAQMGWRWDYDGIVITLAAKANDIIAKLHVG